MRRAVGVELDNRILYFTVFIQKIDKRNGVQ